VSDEFGNLFVCKKTKINDLPLVSSLDNKYIIKYLHSFTDNAKIMHFIMKQYSFDLFEIITDIELLTNYKQKIYFSKLVVGLDYLFKKNIVHFDLKPENILIDVASKTPGDNEDSIVIADFGSCHRFDDIKTLRYNKILGTYEYCSPEMLNNTGFNYKTDIYSLGIVLCEMAIHTNVFPGDCNLKQLTKMKNKGIFGSVKYIKDPDLRDLVLKMTDINPETRIDIDDIKKHPFLSSIDWSLL
jgi:serine/threonine protein kinase